jgi:hypothetical protein
MNFLSPKHSIYMTIANASWKSLIAGSMICCFVIFSSSCGTNTGSATERGYSGSDTEHMEEEVEQSGQKVDHKAGHEGQINGHTEMPADSVENKTDKVDAKEEVL